MKAAASSISQILIRSVVPVILVLAVAYVTNAQRTTPVAKGDWGGTGIALTVTDTGAAIQFDCANGIITSQLRVTKDGTFTAEGTLARDGPGPIRRDSQATVRAVIYKGKVNRRSMSLTMTDAKTGEKLGEYTITKDGPARLHRCY